MAFWEGTPAPHQADKEAFSPSPSPAGDAGTGRTDHRLGRLSASDQALRGWDDPRWRDPTWIDQVADHWADQVAEPLMPLSQGFAPLGRSFQAAFSLLLLPREAGEAKTAPLGKALQSGQPVRSLDRNYV
jgi:hypothetical protein